VQHVVASDSENGVDALGTQGTDKKFTTGSFSHIFEDFLLLEGRNLAGCSISISTEVFQLVIQKFKQ
jgi:hypothetical protein